MALRPPFEARANVDIETTRERLRSAFAVKGPFRAALRGGLIEVAQRETRFWSPQLRARLHAVDDNTTELRGRFAPASEMWTLYIVIYLHLAFAALGAILFGIAQAIVFYIILLVVVMQIVAIGSYFNNKTVVKKAAKSWEHYFPNIDFKMIISSGVTPYVDFKKHYAAALKDGLEGDALKSRLDEAFAQMEEENSLLVESIKRDRMKKEGR